MVQDLWIVVKKAGSVSLANCPLSLCSSSVVRGLNPLITSRTLSVAEQLSTWAGTPRCKNGIYILPSNSPSVVQDDWNFEVAVFAPYKLCISNEFPQKLLVCGKRILVKEFSSRLGISSWRGWCELATSLTLSVPVEPAKDLWQGLLHCGRREPYQCKTAFYVGRYT